MKVSATLVLAVVVACFQSGYVGGHPISCEDVIQKIVATDLTKVDIDRDGNLGWTNIIYNLALYDENRNKEISREEFFVRQAWTFPGALPIVEQLRDAMDANRDDRLTSDEVFGFLAKAIPPGCVEASTQQYFEYWTEVYDVLYKVAGKTPGNCHFLNPFVHGIPRFARTCVR